MVNAPPDEDKHRHIGALALSHLGVAKGKLGEYSDAFKACEKAKKLENYSDGIGAFLTICQIL